MRPTLGRIVIYKQPEVHDAALGSGQHPAMITKVWSDDVVNLQVFFDSGPVTVRTSVVREGVSREQRSAWNWPVGAER